MPNARPDGPCSHGHTETTRKHAIMSVPNHCQAIAWNGMPYYNELTLLQSSSGTLAPKQNIFIMPFHSHTL
jgi:hypothetical protein